jgi:hypothetical protein
MHLFVLHTLMEFLSMRDMESVEFTTLKYFRQGQTFYPFVTPTSLLVDV